MRPTPPPFLTELRAKKENRNLRAPAIYAMLINMSAKARNADESQQIADSIAYLKWDYHGTLGTPPRPAAAPSAHHGSQARLRNRHTMLRPQAIGGSANFENPYPISHIRRLIDRPRVSSFYPSKRSKVLKFLGGGWCRIVL